MYSVCYVLTDREKLEYYHEMAISVFSLRKRNYKGNVFVLLDQRTRDIIAAQKEEECERLGIQFIVVDVPETMKQSMRSRYIKTSMREYIVGDFLYIDTDTVIAEELPEVISEHDIALALDTNCGLREMSVDIRDYEIRFHRLCGYGELDLDKPYYNGGIIWAKDTELAHRFFKEWHNKWAVYANNGKGIMVDQPGLNQANYDMGGVIHRLSDFLNVQVPGDPFPTQYLADAIIIHYFHKEAFSTYLLSDSKIRMLDLYDEQIQQIIDAPKRAFKLGTLLKKDDDRERIVRSNHYFVIERIYSKHPKLFALEERLIYQLLRVLRKFKRVPQKIKNRLAITK